MKLRQMALLLAGFVAGIAVALIVPSAVRVLMAKFIFPEHQREVQRVTSPDDRVDAVALEEDCGAPCSVQYSISIVPRGTPSTREGARRVFVAEDVTKLQLRWSDQRLLDIIYDRARVNAFHNVAYPFSRQGDPESWRYTVEAHLAPISRFSYITNGTGGQ